jgi:hypothetical protein
VERHVAVVVRRGKSRRSRRGVERHVAVRWVAVRRGKSVKAR